MSGQKQGFLSESFGVLLVLVLEHQGPHVAEQPVAVHWPGRPDSVHLVLAVVGLLPGPPIAV